MCGVLFDLDNTLTHRPLTIRAYADAFLNSFSTRLLPGQDPVGLSRFLLELDGGGYVDHAVRMRGIAGLPVWRETPDVLEIASHWHGWFPHNPVPMPGMIAALTRLKRAGCRLGIVTNGSTLAQNAKVDALGIRPLLDGVFVSGTLGHAKPQREIFRLALERLGVQAGSACFVGDHPVNDYQGALQAGIKPVWLSGFHDWPAGMEPATAVVSGLEEASALVLEHFGSVFQAQV